MQTVDLIAETVTRTAMRIVMSRTAQKISLPTKQQTAKQLKNITRTMGFAVKQPNGRKTFKTVDDYFKDTMDNAFMHVLNV